MSSSMFTLARREKREACALGEARKHRSQRNPSSDALGARAGADGETGSTRDQVDQSVGRYSAGHGFTPSCKM
jgi:hypothetical protein